MAGQYADGAAGDWLDLSADPAAEIQAGHRGVSKNWWKSLRSSIRCTRVTAPALRASCGSGWKWSRATFVSPVWASRPKSANRLQKNLDLIINSSGLTDFNPDLRDALATNVDAAVNVTGIRAPVRSCRAAASFHLLRGRRARRPRGRDVASRTTLRRDSPTSMRNANGNALHEFVKQAEQMAESPEVTERASAAGPEQGARRKGSAAEQPWKTRSARIAFAGCASTLTEAGMKRADGIGLAQHLYADQEPGRVADCEVRRRSAHRDGAPGNRRNLGREPFVGWNEGINTSASLSYLAGNFLPAACPRNEKKRLDIIPVDSVCRGMTLIAAAIVERRHEPLYQLATSVTNPCDMRRSIELTSLAHRKHYRAQEGLEYWLRLRLDAIPVSKERYNRMSAPAQKAIVKSIQRIMSPLPLKKTPLARAERNLEKVEKLIELFEPFILHNEQDFVADNVEKLSYALAQEREGRIRVRHAID